MSLIEIRDVHKWYGEFHVLKGISERVEKGEVLVICGPSGSGKSSLIRCLNRLEPIQKGDILFEGTSIYAPEVDVNALRAEVGMVFQQFNTSLIISGSRAEVGSSNSMARGCMASERAMATRCCCPPEISLGRLAA